MQTRHLLCSLFLLANAISISANGVDVAWPKKESARHVPPDNSIQPVGASNNEDENETVPYVATKTKLRGSNSPMSRVHAIHQAAKVGDLVRVQQGVKYDKSLLHHRSDDGTLLHESAHAGHASIVQYLYEAGADVNSKSNSGATPMHLAKVEHQQEVVSYLASLGALDVGPDL